MRSTSTLASARANRRADAPAPAAPHGYLRLRLAVWLPPLVAFATAAAIWYVVSENNANLIPTFGSVWQSLRSEPVMYLENALVTLREIGIGAGGAILLAFFTAVVMAEVRLIERALMPLIVVIMVTPVIAIAPALVVAFGFGPLPKYIVTGIVVYFPVLVNALAGLRSVDQRTYDLLLTLHASRWEIFRELRFPGSMPYMFAGLKIALPLSVVGAAVAEFVAAGQQAGLGSLVTTAAAQAELPVTWAAIALLALLGVLLFGLLAVIRHWVLWWCESSPAAR